MDNLKKYCKHSGQLIDNDCVVCPICGKQVEALSGSNSNVVINNNVSSSSRSSSYASASSGRYYYGKRKNKWVSLFLCIFTICGHKFYEGKVGMGILYLCTAGLFGIGWIVDIVSIAMKSNPYYV